MILTVREKQKAISLILCNLLASILDILSLAILLFIIHFYSPEASSTKPRYLPGWLADHDSIALILFFFLFFIGKSLIGFLIYQAQSRFVYQVASRISQGNLLKFLEGSYPDYIHLDSSVLVRKISQQPNEFCHYVLTGIQQIITESILICLTIVAILIYNAELFLFLFVILLPAVISMSLFAKRRLRKVRANIKTYGEKALQHLQEALSGFIESNLYGKNAFFTQRFADYQRIQNRFLADLVVTQGVSSRFIEVFAVLGLFILVAASKWAGHGQTIPLVTIGAFIAGAYKIIPGVVKILNISGQIKTYEFTLNDLLEEASKNRRLASDVLVKKMHSVSFDQVSFRYPHQQVLSQVSIQLNTGDLVGISGLSGRGKTTLINLLLGFLEPDLGNISINLARCNAAARQAYWKRIAYVKQEPFLLYDTIGNNITLDKDRFDEDQLSKAILQAGLNGLIRNFPSDVHKMITESGKNISGGQRQRIALARAFYKDADLIILDEPFNELDKGSEHALLDQFSRMAAAGKIIILVTHNRESLALCNKIISLDG